MNSTHVSKTTFFTTKYALFNKLNMIFQKHHVLQWIIHFYTPFTKHQFLPWIWRLCCKNNLFYNEFDRPLQIISKSCRNTMCYNEFCTCFKNIFFFTLNYALVYKLNQIFQKHYVLQWIMLGFCSKTSAFTMNYTPCGWEPFSAAQPAVA